MSNTRRLGLSALLRAFAFALAAAVIAPAQTRFEELPPVPGGIGFAGAFVGVSGDALLFAGGANFPEPVWENDKAWHDRVFALSDPAGEWSEVGRLGVGPRAYGASVTWGGELICIGGDDAEQNHADVFALSFGPGGLAERPLASLPEPLACSSATLVGDVVYVVGGQRGKDIASATAAVLRLDLGRSDAAWERLDDIPGGPRAFGFAATQHDGRGERVFAFGGRRADADGPFGLAFLRDLWSLDPSTATWERRADAPVPLMAGAAAPMGQAHVVVLSYADGSVLRDVAAQGVDMRDFGHPGFPRPLYSYHAITDAWGAFGELPDGTENQVTTTAVAWRDRVVLPSGEVRPRVRTPRVWAVEVVPRGGAFSSVDYAVLAIYLLGMVGVGLWFARRNRDTNDYFRGGQSVPFWAAACSIYATMLSSLTYVGLPALVFATDWLLYPGMWMILLTAPIAIRIAMPFYRRIDATSAYEYFGRRFGPTVRSLSAGLFSLFHVSRMGIVMALTALAMSAVIGVDPWVSVLVMGGLCLVYCTLGGIEAVIWTDTIQTVVLLGGAIACVGFVLAGVDGGLGGLWEAGETAGKFRMVDADFGLDSFAHLSIWVVVIGGLGQNLSSYTADQAVVQRYVTTKDTASAARSIWMNGLMAITGSLLFFLLGTGLWAFYRQNPERLDPTIQNDQVFPAFLGAELPVGLTGLIVAGIFAAAQSTVSTSMNSTATVLVTDFFRPRGLCRDEAGYLRLAKALTLSVGVLGTLAGFAFISPEIRSLMAEYFKVIGMFMGALGGLFLLGVTTRRAHGRGALVGLFGSVIVMVVVWQASSVDGYLYAALGIGVCWLLGYVASLVVKGEGADLAGLTLHDEGDGA
jgi:SSS family solute:Na+ symporter